MNIIRWIVFIPVSLAITVLSNVLLREALSILSFFWDAAGSSSRYGDGVSSSDHILLNVIYYIIPAFSFYIAGIVGVRIAPNKKTLAAVIFFSLTLIAAAVNISKDYNLLYSSLAACVGASYVLYIYINEKEQSSVPSAINT